MAEITEHYFRGGKSTQWVSVANGALRVALREKAADGACVEWYELVIR